MQGYIKAWNARGFGFIRRDDGQTDIFVHVNDFAEYRTASKMPPNGSRVEFDTKPSSRPGKADVACGVKSIGADGKPVTVEGRPRRSPTEGADLIAAVFGQ